MIRVNRGSEPAELALIRTTQLARLRTLRLTRPLTSDDIEGYRVVGKALWRAQHGKCCYCEFPVRSKNNDVEHYRPKGRADRSPGSSATHGYWWLAFTWDNLIFSCSSCNRWGKNDQFPLRIGSTALNPEEVPQGLEKPLLIDPGNPADDCGVQHIEFKIKTIQGDDYWVPTPRNRSQRGDWTIRVCRLDDEDLLERYTRHVEKNVFPRAQRIKATLNKPKELSSVMLQVESDLLDPAQQFVGLSYDALAYYVGAELGRKGINWPPMPT